MWVKNLEYKGAVPYSQVHRLCDLHIKISIGCSKNFPLANQKSCSKLPYSADLPLALLLHEIQVHHTSWIYAKFFCSIVISIVQNKSLCHTSLELHTTFKVKLLLWDRNPFHEKNGTCIFVWETIACVPDPKSQGLCNCRRFHVQQLSQIVSESLMIK